MADGADVWIPGYRFRGGKLLIFERERLTVIRGWPQPQASEKARGQPWRGVRPTYRLVRPYRRRKPTARELSHVQGLLPGLGALVPPTRSELAEQKRRAFEAFRFAMPQEVARALEHFQSDHSRCCRCCAARPSFLDLLQANPALAFCLVHRRVLGRRLGSQAAPSRQRL